MIRHAAPVLLVAGLAVLGPAAEVRAASADDPVAMVASLVSSVDAEESAIGLDRVRVGIKGEAATARLTTLLPTLGPTAQARLVAALGDRGDRTALPAVKTLFSATAEPAVRRACLTAIGLLGGPAEVPLFVSLLSAADPEQSAARGALLILEGEATAAAIFAAWPGAAPPVRAQLIAILGERNAWGGLPEALPALVAAVGDADAGVRGAALAALAKAGGPDEVPGLARALLAAAEGSRHGVSQTLVAICTRGRDPGRSAAAFFALFTAATDADREVLVVPLGGIGGPQARGVVDALIESGDPVRRKSGIVAFSRWPDGSAIDRLLELVAAATDPAERDMLLNAVIRIAPQPNNTLTDERKLEVMQKALGLCRTDKDRARVLERVHAIRTAATLRFAAPFLDDPAVAEAAARSVVELAHHRDLRDAAATREEFVRALDKVLVVAKDAETRERAAAYKEGRTWKRQ